MFSLSTTFDREDFTRLLVERFGMPAETVEAFFDAARDMNFYDDQAIDHRAAFRAVLSRPGGRGPPADGADHLRQRLDAGRPGAELRHRVLELHVEGRVHVPRRHRSADRADGSRNCGATASTSAPRCTCREDRTSPAAASQGVTVDGRQIGARAVVSNANLLGTIFDLVGDEHLGRRLRRAGPGRPAEQLQHAGLHGPAAGRNARRRRLRRPAVQLDRPGVPHRVAVEPRHHQPHLFVLLSAGPGRAGTAASSWPARTPTTAIGPACRRKTTQAGKRDLIEATLDAAGQVRARHPRKLAWVECATPLTFERYTRHLEGASFGTKFEGLAVSRASRSRSPACIMPAAWALSCRAGWGRSTTA